MRKFTKGLLMTFVATAMSLGAYAQVENGYYRVINAGANQYGFTYVKVTGESTATLQCTAEQAITAPGTVMYLNVKKAEYSGNNLNGGYIDIDPENDLEVVNLRSQGVDASDVVFKGMMSNLRNGFTWGLKSLAPIYGWDIDQAQILDDMFEYSKMYMTPVKTADGEDAWYLKSSTPNTEVLANALTEDQKAALQALDPNKPISGILWDLMYQAAIDYFKDNALHQLVTDFGLLKERIHMGHTYYLSAGWVNLNNNNKQEMVYTESDPEISFCNNNKIAYQVSGLIPEVDFLGDYSKWKIEKVVENADANYTGTNYFAVNPSQTMVGKNDGKYYTSLYVDFPMKRVGEGVRVWGIVGQPVITETKDGLVAVVTTQEYTDVVPPRQGVVVECTYSDAQGPAGNCLQPVGTPMQATGNTMLDGLFFDTYFVKNNEGNNILYGNNYTRFDQAKKENIRVLNRKDNKYDGGNPIGFYSFSGNMITGNKAFLVYDGGSSNVNIIFVTPEEYANGINETVVANNNKAIYDLQGRLVNNPTKGLYIVNGKKMVIK